MIEVIILAFALSMDAFAVSIGLGLKARYNFRTIILKSSLFFGFFQAFMPIIGYLCGVGLNEYIEEYDHWIAFVLLTLIGGKMIKESFEEDGIENEICTISNRMLYMLAIATSIDAMAAGFTLMLFDLHVALSIAIIGIVTFIMSYLGAIIGKKGGAKYESKAEFFGGVVLVGIGVKVLVEHLFF